MGVPSEQFREGLTERKSFILFIHVFYSLVQLSCKTKCQRTVHQRPDVTLLLQNVRIRVVLYSLSIYLG